MPKKRKGLPAHVQRERFIQAAKEAGCDESGEAFERTFKTLVPPKKRTRK